MSNDIRLSTSFWEHRKTVKLMRSLGIEAAVSLQKLWMWVAANRPDGDLSGLDTEDIEISARWGGDAGALVSKLRELSFLDGEDGNLSLHGWVEHNPWALESKKLSDRGRFNRLKQLRPELAADLENNGITELNREDYENYKTGCGGVFRGTTGHPQDTPGPTPARGIPGVSPAPGPAPAPVPTNEIEDTSLRSVSSCPEPSAKASEPQQVEQKAKPGNHDQPDLAILTFPLAKKGETFPVTQSDIDEWGESFPGIDLLQELRHCLQWSRDNPTRRKTRAGIRRHITSWLAKAQDRARAPTSASPGQGGQTVRRTASQQYMHEVGELLEAINAFDENGCGQRVGATAPALPGGGAQRQIDQHTG